ncbi:DUF6226 family protein [Nocardioides sp. 31GB23]|uniref:DUF6226 family protein n=1 Tax=Nocardioides sp. 31GB23 TaxID=3156065 RepID=UPI0032B01604
MAHRGCSGHGLDPRPHRARRVLARGGRPRATSRSRADGAGWRVVPRAAGALPLRVVGDASVDDLLVDVDLRAGEPPVGVLETDCHCDACDSGSADLLEVHDRAWLDVVGGELVHLEAPGRTATGGREGWSGSWDGRSTGETRAEQRAESEAIAHDLDAVRRGCAPRPLWQRVVHGAPWT